MLLFFGFAVLPIGAGLSSNIAGFEHTRMRGFCGSCHVMEPFTDDASDPNSLSLPALHARNETFGTDNCYQCHSDYGMFGTVATKWGGLHHVWAYYIEGYADMPVEEALPQLELYRPFPNANCMRCHSTRIPSWLEVGEHRSLLEEIREGSAGCMGAGCHGPAHPYAGPDSHESHEDPAAEEATP
jgi:cytochrome c-type protein NapC